MPRAPRILFQGAIYHVTFRGNNRQEIFADVRDRRRFVEKLEECADKCRVRLYLYCLMQNHVHLLVETPLGNLNRFMASLLTGYTLFFNIKNQRSGHLFQGRYHAQLVSGDDYLLRLSRYIHLNPVRTDFWDTKSVTEKAEFLDQYAWSSYRAYSGLSTSPDWLDRGPLMTLVAPKSSQPESSYRAFVQAGMAESDDDIRTLIRSKNRAIGSKAFIESIMSKAAPDPKDKSSRLRKTGAWTAPEKVKASLMTFWKFSAEDLDKRRAHGFNRAVLCMAWHKFSGLGYKKAGELIGIGSSGAVCSLIRKWKDDPRVLPALKHLETALN